MLNIKNEEQVKNLKDVRFLLLEVKCLAKLGTLASDSYIINNKLQMHDNLEYNFTMRRIVNLIEDVENILL